MAKSPTMYSIAQNSPKVNADYEANTPPVDSTFRNTLFRDDLGRNW